MDNVFVNPVARRVFIQFHEKINSQFFIEILSGNLPKLISEKSNNSTESEKVLKLLICLKRSANMLGMDAFYDYKFKQIANKIMDNNVEHGVSTELVDLWKEVSEGSMDKIWGNDFFI